MGLWNSIFGQASSSRSANRNRTQLCVDSLENREVPTVVFVGGWGASSYQYANETTYDRPAATSPIQSQTDLTAETETQKLTITFSDVLISSYQSSGSAGGAAADDVIVDGRIITAENYDSAR